MKNEKALFQKMAALASPDWAVSLNAAPGQVNWPEQTVCLYLLDTSNDWTVAGAMAPAGFGKAQAQAKALGLSGSALLSAADQALGFCSRSSLAQGAPEVHQALQVVAAALTSTRTYELVKPDVSGHWLYLAYRGFDQSITCRPAFFRSAAPGFVPVPSLFTFARQVVRQDLSNASGQVFGMLRRGGGAMLSATFK